MFWTLFCTISPYGWRSGQLYHPGAHSYRHIPKKWTKTTSPSELVPYDSVIYQQTLFCIYIPTSNTIIKGMRSLMKEQRGLIYLWLRVLPVLAKSMVNIVFFSPTCGISCFTCPTLIEHMVLLQISVRTSMEGKNAHNKSLHIRPLPLAEEFTSVPTETHPPHRGQTATVQQATLQG